MNYKPILTSITCGALLLALVSASDVRAQSSDTSAIQYPIAELGGCSNKEACKTYCDDSANIDACISYAEKNGLMPKEEIEMAKKFLAAGAKGPGGCTGKDSCEAYCNDTEHIDACVAFAEENGLMSGDELAEAKKVQAAIRSGVKPPPCGGKRACDAYCESPDNMPACIAFAKAAGLMTEEEQANADKMLQAIQNGAKPPACRGKAECDAYCGQEEHFNECLEFGKAAGFMTDAEYEMAKKTGGKGPGGCKGKEECDAFCSSSQENEDLCINFQIEKGIMSADEQRRMQEDAKQFRDSFTNMPPEVARCLSEAWGADNFEKLKAGTMRPSRWTGDAMSVCFGQFEQERMQNERPSGPQPGGEQQFSGPRPEGEFRCEGENCAPPSGPIPPEGYGPPPVPCEGENCAPPPPPPQTLPPTESVTPVSPIGSTEPAPTPAPAPTVETSSEPVPQVLQIEPIAPVPMETSPISTESLTGAVILFFNSFGS